MALAWRASVAGACAVTGAVAVEAVVLGTTAGRAVARGEADEAEPVCSLPEGKQRRGVLFTGMAWLVSA